jgi:hypothetical protein
MNSLGLTKRIARSPLSAAAARRVGRASDGGSEGIATRFVSTITDGEGKLKRKS